MELHSGYGEVKMNLQWSHNAYQSHSPEHGDAVDALHGQIDEAGDDDDEVEDVPAAGKVVLAQRGQLQNGLKGEEGREHLSKKVNVKHNKLTIN